MILTEIKCKKCLSIMYVPIDKEESMSCCPWCERQSTYTTGRILTVLDIGKQSVRP